MKGGVYGFAALLLIGILHILSLFMQLPTPLFSQNAIHEELLHKRAGVIFGADWKRDKRLKWDVNKLICGEWTMEWGNYFGNEDFKHPTMEQPGVIFSTLFWCKKEHNSPDGRPAHIEFYPNGDINRREYHLHGVCLNPNKRTPAACKYHIGNKIFDIEWMVNGILTDSDYGHPAYTKYSCRGELLDWRSSKMTHIDRKRVHKWTKAANRKMALEECEDLVGGNTVFVTRTNDSLQATGTEAIKAI